MSLMTVRNQRAGIIICLCIAASFNKHESELIFRRESLHVSTLRYRVLEDLGSRLSSYTYKARLDQVVPVISIRGGYSSASFSETERASLMEDSPLERKNNEDACRDDCSETSIESFPGEMRDDTGSDREDSSHQACLKYSSLSFLNLSSSVQESCDKWLEDIFRFKEVSGRLRAICMICNTSTCVDRLMTNQSKGYYTCSWTKFFICMRHLMTSRRHISKEKQKTYLYLKGKQHEDDQQRFLAVIKLINSIKTTRLLQSRALSEIQWSRAHLLFMLKLAPQHDENFVEFSKDFQVMQFLQKFLTNPNVPPLPDFKMSMMMRMSKSISVGILRDTVVSVQEERKSTVEQVKFIDFETARGDWQTTRANGVYCFVGERWKRRKRWTEVAKTASAN
eukprot:753053-Hanusia_phi.AAC.4